MKTAPLNQRPYWRLSPIGGPCRRARASRRGFVHTRQLLVCGQESAREPSGLWPLDPNETRRPRVIDDDGACAACANDIASGPMEPFVAAVLREARAWLLEHEGRRDRRDVPSEGRSSEGPHRARRGRGVLGGERQGRLMAIDGRLEAFRTAPCCPTVRDQAPREGARGITERPSSGLLGATGRRMALPRETSRREAHVSPGRDLERSPVHDRGHGHSWRTGPAPRNHSQSVPAGLDRSCTKSSKYRTDRRALAWSPLMGSVCVPTGDDFVTALAEGPVAA